MESELELGVRQDEPLLRRLVVREPVEREREALEVAREVGPDEIGELRSGDVLIVAALGLGRRREDRLGKLLGFEKGGGELLAGDGPEGLVLGPGGAGDVAARDALDVDALAMRDEHRPAVQRLALAEGPREAA